jgi:hypothetical protein
MVNLHYIVIILIPLVIPTSEKNGDWVLSVSSESSGITSEFHNFFKTKEDCMKAGMAEYILPGVVEVRCLSKKFYQDEQDTIDNSEVE